MKWTEKLPRNACDSAIDWCKTQRSISAAWRECKRGDWMLWLLAHKVEQGSKYHKKIVRVACECARLALKYVPEGEERPRIAIETAEKWSGGMATLREVEDAAYAASVYAASADAASASADAADAASASAYVAYAAYAADAAAAASAAAASAYAEAERENILAVCADIVRKAFSVYDIYRVLREVREHSEGNWKGIE